MAVAGVADGRRVPDLPLRPVLQVSRGSLLGRFWRCEGARLAVTLGARPLLGIGPLPFEKYFQSSIELLSTP